MKRFSSLSIWLFLVLFFFYIILTTIAAARESGIVNADNVNVRKVPDGQVVGSIQKGRSVGILKEYNGWSNVFFIDTRKTNKSGGLVYGWIESNFIDKQSAAPRPSRERSPYSDCETEYKTGDDVCIEMEEASIDCDESYAGNYYDECTVDVSYLLTTDYKGGTSIETRVECDVSISYYPKDGYSSSDYSSEEESHSLYSHAYENHSMSLYFSFSSYEEIVKVEIDSVDCEISSVDLY